MAQNEQQINKQRWCPFPPQILPHSSECRGQRDECDLAEYCDGTSSVCPENVFSVNGLPCDAGHGYCYNGQCPQKADQCVKMYGPCRCYKPRHYRQHAANSWVTVMGGGPLHVPTLTTIQYLIVSLQFEP